MLDAIITLVDAKHAMAQLDEHHEAQEQVGFADRILLSKTDLVTIDEVNALQARLKRMNLRATIQPAHFGKAPIDQLLDIRGFNLNAILEIEPKFLTEETHEHDDDITSFIFQSDRTFNGDQLEAFLSGIVQVYGPQMLRYKGVLSVAGEKNRLVLQGVHMLMGTANGPAWAKTEKRNSRMVFIGKDLPKDMIVGGLNSCLVA